MESKASKQASKKSERGSIPTPLPWTPLLPSVIAPRRLSFSSSRAEKNFSILSGYIWVRSETGSSSSALLTSWRMGLAFFFFFFFRLSSPLSVISLLPCVSLQLFEETQEVCRNVPPQFAVYTARRTAHRPTQHSYDARYEKKNPACMHTLIHTLSYLGFQHHSILRSFH